MKLTTKILSVILVLLTTGLFASNMLLKKEYEKSGKNDIYLTYGAILEKPFKYLNITGGNVTKIAWEPAPTAAVRVLKSWGGYKTGAVKAFVRNDTLYLHFPNTGYDYYEKRYIKWNTLVRIFSPELLSVNGVDTHLGMFKAWQTKLSVNMSGKSQFEIENLIPQFDSIRVIQRDSSEVFFERSLVIKGTASFHARSVIADIQGASLLDIGHGQVDSLQLNIGDSAGIILSGGTLKKNKVYHFTKP
jgi:hypothetical protein